jgi:uncharacterized membrane protein YjfL (UPF0719 family)
MQQGIDLLKTTVFSLPKDFAYLAVVLVMLVVARLFKDILTPYKLSEQLTARDNPAVGMSVAGYYLAVLIVCIGPLRTPSAPGSVLWKDLLDTAGYMALGILLLNLARIIVDKVLLPKFSTTEEIIRDRNVGAGSVEMGAYIASGLIVAAALQGRGGGPQTTLAFFGLGQVGLVVYGYIYMAVCRYNVAQEIENDNVAAGVALGMNLIAMGLILVGAIAGDFTSWTHNLTLFGVRWLFGVVVLLLLRVFIDFLLLPGVRIDKEIQQDRNLNAAWVEGVVLAGLAGLLLTLM